MHPLTKLRLQIIVIFVLIIVIYVLIAQIAIIFWDSELVYNKG